MIGIGVDTGGTYTDAVVFDDEARKVLAACKTLTTPSDLTACIGAAIDKLPFDLVSKAERVSLSTTLATNACVEGKGGRAKLVIAGTNDAVLHRVDAPKRYGFAYSDVLPIDFKGSYDGLEAELPDWEAICDDNAAFFDDADSYGIAGLYALNNGAVVERSGAEYLAQRYGKPVIMATDVALSPNVLERGATALLNARLIPIIENFVAAMHAALQQRGLDIPIGIVRSNGTLMSAQAAKVSPVETIVSGPASSAVGALSLSAAPESLVIDIGGTTCDIAIVHDSRPVTSDGIRIGAWRTQVKGARIDTIGLGGDTRVLLDNTGRLSLSNRRALPFCVAARQWPAVKDALKAYLGGSQTKYNMYYEMLYLAHEPEDRSHYTSGEQALLDLLADGPIDMLNNSLSSLAVKPDRLEEEGVVMRIGFTPTDAMHVKGEFTEFDAEASRLAAQCMLKSLEHELNEMLEEDIQGIAERVYDLAKRRLYAQIVRVLLQDRYESLRDEALDGQLQAIIDDAWDRYANGVDPRPFDVNFETSMSLIGIGAPTHVFLPDVARALHTPCVIPDHADVANAIGALCARVIVEEEVRVVTHHGPGGIIDGYTIQSRGLNRMFRKVEDALEMAEAHAREAAELEARRRGIQGDLDCTVTIDLKNIPAMGESTNEWYVRATVK